MSKLIAPLVAVLLASLGRPASAATVYIVGDTAGWDTSAELSSWPANKSFVVGDVLWFQYSRYHSLHEVDKWGYDRCSTSGALMDSRGGNRTVTLTSPGRRYFICGVQSHCLGGMRLQVDVQGTTAGPSPAGAPLGSQTPPPESASVPGSVPPESTVNSNRGSAIIPSATSGAWPTRMKGVLGVVWSCCVILFWAFVA